MKIFRYLMIIVFAMAAFEACKEEGRFGISSKDTTIPEEPVVLRTKPLYGGARVFYKLPKDEQLLQVIAEIKANNGKTFQFSASYFKDSLDVYGMGDTVEYTFNLYAETRAGNRSNAVPVTVKPLTSGIWHVKKSIVVRPGFGALCVDWKNDIEQTVNVFVDVDFNSGGIHKQVGLVYSSNSDSVREFVRDLPNEPINMKIRVEDIYGNTTDHLNLQNLMLLEDIKLPKKTAAGDMIWKLPKTNDSIDWIPMCFGDSHNGRIDRVIDDVIDRKDGMSNYMHAGARGRTGNSKDGNVWNLIIDLGEYYELSRIITHQRHDMTDSDPRRNLYRAENVGHFSLWILDEDQPGNREWDIYGEKVKGIWVRLSEHYIPIPQGLAGPEYPKVGLNGDESYMYPDEPKFTKPVRWFRYEALSGFVTTNGIPYGNADHNCLSEVTLYGRKADKNK